MEYDSTMIRGNSMVLKHVVCLTSINHILYEIVLKLYRY